MVTSIDEEEKTNEIITRVKALEEGMKELKEECVTTRRLTMEGLAQLMHFHRTLMKQLHHIQRDEREPLTLNPPLPKAIFLLFVSLVSHMKKKAQREEDDGGQRIPTWDCWGVDAISSFFGVDCDLQQGAHELPGFSFCAICWPLHWVMVGGKGCEGSSMFESSQVFKKSWEYESLSMFEFLSLS
ncbi:hypothetical protein AKJ16_DCAP15037 [Drosera capensis]